MCKLPNDICVGDLTENTTILVVELFCAFIVVLETTINV